MFGIFKSKQPVRASNGFFQVTVKADRGTNTTLPTAATGAFLTAYASAASPEVAFDLVQDKLAELGYERLELRGSVIKLNAEYWTAYLEQSWPEAAGRLPSQDEVTAITGPRVFLGAVAGFEAPGPTSSERDHVAGEMLRYLTDVWNGVQEAKEVRTDAFIAAHVLGRELVRLYQGSEMLPRILLMSLHTVASVLENEAPYCSEPSRVVAMADAVRQTFYGLISGSAPDDHLPGIPRVC